MAKKKKSQLKPVARGFATTSQPSKRALAEAQEAAAIAESEAAAASTPGPTPDQAASVTPTGDSSAVIDSNELDSEEQTWQDMVDRWQNKTDREITRTIQIIETERRLAKSLNLPQVNLDPLWRRRVLELISQEEEGKPKISSESSNKILPRVAIIYGVLRRLGFQHAASIRCLQSVQNIELDEALDWIYLHCDTDELPGPSNPQSDSIFKPSTSMRCGTTFTPRLTPAIPNPSISQNRGSSSAKLFSRNTPRSVPSNPSTPPTPVCASDEESLSTFESDEELDPNILHARLHLRILNLRRSGLSETDPKVAALTKKQREVAGDYMFDAKDAAREFLSLKVAMDEADLKARLRGECHTTGPTTERKKKAGKSSSKPPPGPPAPEPSALEEDEDEGETMFSTMLDEMPTTETSNTGTTITVRNLPVPKHASFAKSPKTLLSETARKIDKYAVVTYEPVNGSSRAVRVKCDVRWNGGRTSEWRMDGVGCWDRDQAEWFVSTVAFHALAYPLPDEDDIRFVAGGGAQSGAAGISVSGVGNFPPVYRDLWSELEEERKEKEAARNRTVWKCLFEVAEARGAAGESIVIPSTKKTATPPRAAGRLPNLGINLYDQALQIEFAVRQASPAYQAMLQQRQTLPIAAHRDIIIQTLSSHQVLVLSGETGCGKSTQLPAFILEDQLSRGIPCKIFCTEPRRISAISLAQRVSAEQGEPPGAVETSSGLVGYSVRLDSHIGPKTKLAYVTYGIALKMLENGSVGGQAGTAFDELTHVIIDEVHERSIESDFLLIVLRSLIERRKDLKVILMSATVDSEKISQFFGGCPTLQVPGRTFPVDIRYLEDAVEFTGWKIDNLSPYAKQFKDKLHKSGKLDWNEDLEVHSDDEDVPNGEHVVKFEKRYSQQSISTINLFNEQLIPYDLIVRLLERICFEDSTYSTYSTAVLVFMPGLNEIRKLADMLAGHEHFGRDAFRVYPLHSTISTEDQGAVFNIPPAGVRKIVIATNIAETGITIPDITCVIDTGKHREMRFDEKRQLSRLVETHIARSNAAQRRGRAGRVRDGLCFHLFTKSRHDTQLIDHPSPEMLRLSLSDLALRIKMMNIFNGLSVEEVLSKALDPPIVLNVQRAVANLVEVKALTPTEEITPMGRLLSKLPTDVHLGKFLLFASIFRCLDPALTIAAALTSKSPFITPFGHEAQAALAKASFRSDDSDFLTIHNAFASWRRAYANGQSAARTFCKRSFLSYQNLQQIEEIRQQYLGYLVDASFVRVDAACQKELSRARFTSRQRVRFVSLPPDLNTNAQNNESWAINAALGAGLFPKLLVVEKGKMQTLGNCQPVAFHPSSVNFRKRPEDIVGSGMCLMYFTLMHSKKLYVWETSPVDDHALLLLCGDVEVKPAVGQIIVDRKLKFQVDAKTALAFKALRTHLASALHSRLRGKVPNMKLEEWVQIVFDVLSCKAAGQ